MESGGTDNTISIDVGLVLSFAGINDRKSVEVKEFEKNSSQIQAKRRLIVFVSTTSQKYILQSSYPTTI